MTATVAIRPALGLEVTRAVIFLGSAPETKVAGVPILLRSLRVLSRAGFTHVQLIGRESEPHWQRWASKLGFELAVSATWQAEARPVLLLAGNLAFQKEAVLDLKREVRKVGHWLSLSAEQGESVSALIGPGLLGEFASLNDALVDARQAPEMVSEHTTRRPVLTIRDGRSARRFHRMIEDTIIKPTDGMFARWNRKISLPLTRILVHLPVSPNMVTYFTLLVSALGAFLLSRGGYFEMLAGALVTQAASILDGNDGELARIKVMDSDLGTWLDTICDYASYFLTFGGIAYGLYRASGNPVYLLMGALFVVGCVIAMTFAAVMRKQHAERVDAGSLAAQVNNDLNANSSNPAAYLAARLKHFGTRAVFSYFVVLFGLLNLWPVMLGFAVAGAHVFWLGAWYNGRFVGQTSPMLEEEAD